MSTRHLTLPPQEADDEEELLDLVALQADDELITALASGLAVSAGDAGESATDDKVSAILAAWRAEVDAEPIPELVDTDTAVAAVRAARRPSGRARHLVPVAAAAAALVTLLGGVSLSAHSAQPDDVLWPVSKVLYSERAESVLAADRVEQHIAKAKRAIAGGDPVSAAKELAAAKTELAVVRPEEGRTELVEVQDFLVAKADETVPGVPNDPGTPLTTDSKRKVPAGAEITAPSARTSSNSSPAGTPSSGTGSSGSSAPAGSSGPGGSSGTGSAGESSPAKPAQPDPRLVDPRQGDPRVAAVPEPASPAPAPAEQPEVSTAPTPDSPAPAPPQSNPGSTAPEQSAPESTPQSSPVDEGTSATLTEGETIGATASDTEPSQVPAPTS